MSRNDNATAADVLGHLQDYYREHMVLPSYEAVRARFGLSSKSVVQRRFAALSGAGFVRVVSADDNRFAPGPRFFEREAGRPIPAGLADRGDAALDERIAIDAYLVHEPSRTRLHPINGESMIGAGLADGDFAVVEVGATASVGDQVLALIDGEETIKTLARDAGGLYLRPENPAFPDLRPASDLSVLGVVVGTFGRRGRRSR